MPRPSAILLFGGLDVVFPVGIEVYEIVDVEVDDDVVREEENEVVEDDIVVREEENEVVEDDNDGGRNPIVPTATNMPLEAQHEVFPAPQQ